MHYAGLDKNDYINGEGVCVSLWMQGCPHHCPGCHNPETWDFFGGQVKSHFDIWSDISAALTANGVHRNFSILGGEPLAPGNIEMTNLTAYYVKQNHPNTKIYLWTGYTLDELKNMGEDYCKCLKWADVIIDGRYVQELRDVRLKLRGSSNQRILYKNIDY